MKKIITFIALLTFVLTLSAQRSGSTTVLQSQEIQKVLTMTAADTITQHGTVYWVFNINKPALQLFAFSVSVDTITNANTNHVYFDVLGSLDGVNYIATTATQVKYGGSADSTFYLGDVATGVLWKYLKVQGVSQSLHVRGCRVSSVSMKVVSK
jgi:hypothetical protein